MERKPSRIGALRREVISDFGFKFNRDRRGDIIDFTDPNGDTFVLQPGEQVVFLQNANGSGKKIMIRLATGQEIPFEEWKEDKLPN